MADTDTIGRRASFCAEKLYKGPGVGSYESEPEFSLIPVISLSLIPMQWNVNHIDFCALGVGE